MQDDKNVIFRTALGKVLQELRKTNKNKSLNKLALKYDINKGSLAKLERKVYDCHLSTAWKFLKYFRLNIVFMLELGCYAAFFYRTRQNQRWIH